MFNYIVILGSGAITYLTIRKCVGYSSPNFHSAAIEFMMYVMPDMVTTFLCLSPFGRISLVTDLNGRYELLYGSSTILFSIVAAVIWGLIFSFAKKNVKIDVEIEDTKKNE
jgi:hypothetical protein